MTLSVENARGWLEATGGIVAVLLFVQFITGVFLWMAYSASSQTAWESVYYIQDVMTGGWLLRGIHHYTAQAMIILLVLHLMQVVLDGAYRAPREINFWIGLVLLNLVLAISLTGYLLPWDQRGYWSTSVATSLMAVVPGGVGPVIQRLVIGGPNYGHHTLTRFFADRVTFTPFAGVPVRTGASASRAPAWARCNSSPTSRRGGWRRNTSRRPGP